jgi:hypothetical protein
MTISELITLLNQSQALVTRTGAANSSLLLVKNRLITLGQGLIRRDIVLRRNPELASIKAQLDALIAGAPGESALNDAHLLQLAEARTSVIVEHNDPTLPTAKELAHTRNTEAKTLYETAHLACEAFAEMENFGTQIKTMTPTAMELDFLTQYRIETDRFFLIANYLEVTLDNFVTVTWQLYDWATINLNDPRTKVVSFDDKLPFALLPVRVETRFMTIKHVRDNLAYGSASDVIRSSQQVTLAENTKKGAILHAGSNPLLGGTLQPAPTAQVVPDTHELWVRIYPDDIAIHTHESLLTQLEINAGKIYWNEMWSIGTTPPTPPVPPNTPSLRDKELGAWRVLCSGSGPKRAAWIAKQTTPTNIALRPALPNAATPVPIYPTLAVKPASWSQQPHSKVLPDRFVVRVYNNSNTYREVVGSLVPSPLPVGFNPAVSYNTYLNQSGAGLNMPPELRWLTEFEEAEKVGMGIRISLQGNEATAGFERLLVLGFKQELSATDGQQLLEELFDNHHYAAGLAILPQGTATNNTDEKKSGYAALEPGQEESFATEREANLFTTSTNHYLKADGQRLAEALGLNSSIFQHVAQSNTYDVKESMAMSRALWSATLGYYMKHLLMPSTVTADITNTRDFFTKYVHGRGLIPAFRVRQQPYGVLPTTVYSRWSYSNPVYSGPYSYHAKLHNKILEPLRMYWKTAFCPQVQHVNPPYPTPDPNPDKLLINILGLHPASLEFHQRVSVGAFKWSNMVKFMLSIGMTQQQANTLDFSGLEAALDAQYKGGSLSLNYSGIPRIFGMSFAGSHR